MKNIKWLLLLLCSIAHAQAVYNYFAPGGALSGNATSQTVNLSATGFVNGILPITNGGIGALSFASAHLPVIVGTPASGNCVQWASSVSIADSGSTCGGGGGGGSAFSALTSSINTTATMVVGTGASLSAQGSGTIVATNVPLPASPTGTVGLTAVIGAAATFMRSDAAPALSQAISPTWLNQHTFSNPGLPILIKPAATTYAEGPQMADQQTNGHSWGWISGYCNGANPGTMGLHDYTPNTTALCVGSDHSIFTGGVTGGDEGPGTINAAGLFVNGVAVSGSTAANPSASIGLTAVNGSATTFMRSDAAPPLSQSISPTMTGTWNWTNPSTIGSITPSSATWASEFRLNDQQISGHSYGDIAGYCNGAAAGTWTLYDYTAALSRICVAATGAVTVEPPSSGGTALLVDGSSGTNVNALIVNSGNSGATAAADALVSRSGSSANNIQAGPNITLSDSGATTVSVLQQSGGQTELWQYNGSWIRDMYFATNRGMVVGAATGGSEGAGTINATGLYVNGIAAAIPSTGSVALSYVSGCATGSFAPTINYTVIGNVVTFKLTPSDCSISGTQIVASGLPAAIQPASNTGVASVVLGNNVQQVGQVLIQGGSGGQLTIVPATTSGSCGTATTNETSGSYTLN